MMPPFTYAMRPVAGLLLAGSLIGLGGCQSQPSAQTAAPPLPVAVVEYRAGQGPLEAVVQQAVQRRKTPILYFYAEWCGPCRRFRSSLVAPEVQRALATATLIKINVDSSQALAGRYGVQAVPTFVKVDAAGQPQATIDGGAWDNDTPTAIGAAMADFVARDGKE